MKLLSVEDNKVTNLANTRILKKEYPLIDITITENGQEALDYLQKCNKVDLPYFILLDLNMPIMNGIEFLSAIRRDDNFSTIPVVIHTTSSNLEDYYKCKNLGVSGYFVKNVDFNKYKETLITIGKYWINSFNNRI